MKIADNIGALVGRTPLLRLHRIEEKYRLKAELVAKLESFNPAGSAKDRVAKNMIERAEAEGKLAPGATIIEPTSGNTGIGLAAVGISRGYKVILTMPDTMSVERRNLLRAYGAQVVLTPGAEGMNGAIAKANELAAGIEGAFIPGQFDNKANAEAHYLSTGPEIWEDTEGKVDAFVAGVGTGGTITGTGRYLKEKNPALFVAAVEPFGSPLLSGGKAGSHGLQGIGANFIPSILDRGVYDEVIPVKEEDAYTLGRDMVGQEGVLVGISSGAALWAAVQLAQRAEFEGRRIVVLLPDTGERYLSTAMFAE